MSQAPPAEWAEPSLNLLTAGASVTADLSEEGLTALSKDAEGLAGTLHTTLCDVTDESAVKALIAFAEEAMDGVSVLINNAGIFLDSKLVSVDRETGKVRKTMSLAQWSKVIDVDLTGPFLCTREFAANHIDRRSGEEAVVINMSSVSRHGNPGQTNYSAAKAGLVADTKL